MYQKYFYYLKIRPTPKMKNYCFKKIKQYLKLYSFTLKKHKGGQLIQYGINIIEAVNLSIFSKIY